MPCVRCASGNVCISGHISGRKRATGDPLLSKRPDLGCGIMWTIMLVCEKLIWVTQVSVLLVQQPQLPESWTRADNLLISDSLQRSHFCIAKSASPPKEYWNILEACLVRFLLRWLTEWRQDLYKGLEQFAFSLCSPSPSTPTNKSFNQPPPLTSPSFLTLTRSWSQTSWTAAATFTLTWAPISKPNYHNITWGEGGSFIIWAERAFLDTQLSLILFSFT